MSLQVRPIDYGLRDYSELGQLGLEPTLQEYIDNTVAWCREVWRVLRDDGTFFLNLGDSYNGSGGAGGDYNPGGLKEGQPKYPGRNEIGLKPKDLMLVPHRVAIALQNDGWWVRSDIVWHKPNPMPESVKDRPTKSHEYIFLLTKNEKYYYDQDAIREEHKYQKMDSKRADYNSPSPTVDKHLDVGQVGKTRHGRKRSDDYHPAGRNKRSVWIADEDEFLQFLQWKASQIEQKKDTWTMTTKPYKGAHFATFPPELPETCIKAGTSEKGVCPVCGSQWARVVEHENMVIRRSERTHSMGRTRSSGTMEKPANSKTIGWKPICSHNEEPIPATVCDPFAGSGTALMVARQLGRNGIGIDLSWEYLQLARKRTGEKAWKEWVEGKRAYMEENLEELPLFSVQNK